MVEACCSAMLFDMDGVLIDSTKAVARVWSRWALQHGFNPQEVVKRAQGRPSISTLRDYLPHADHEAENRIIEQAEMEDLEGVIPIRGSEQLLASLPSERWAIVTSSTRRLAERRLQVAGLNPPDCFVTSSDIVHGKPHPEPYVKAATKLGFPSSDCVVVEDVPAGIQAGKAAGSRVIALRTNTVEEDLRDAGADWVVPDCTHIAVRNETAGLRLLLKLEVARNH